MTMIADTSGGSRMGKKGDKEVIHSGHFMVSDFEAEAQDDEENVLLEIPGDDDDEEDDEDEKGRGGGGRRSGGFYPGGRPPKKSRIATNNLQATFSIDSSLTKLFNAMSIAYRQKITSPKWNRFKGLKLRWKDKIRLNNVIWRCWHMQFIRKKKMTVCQFSLDVDMHNRPEAIVLEGKYWKRQLDAVTAEYKKWRIYYKNRVCGSNLNDSDASMFDFDGMDFSRSYTGNQMSLDDGDLTEFMDFTDVLFSTMVNAPQPFAFPNPREIARGTGNSDFIQPGLIQLQPNLDDFMELGLQEMLGGRGLPTVPEEEFLPQVGTAPDVPGGETSNSPGGGGTGGDAFQYTARITTNTFIDPASPPTHSPTHKPPTPTPILPQHLSPVYRTPQVPPLQQQQQQQLVPLPVPSPPAGGYQPSSLGRASIQSQPLHLQQSQPQPPHHHHPPPTTATTTTPPQHIHLQHQQQHPPTTLAQLVHLQQQQQQQQQQQHTSASQLPLQHQPGSPLHHHHHQQLQQQHQQQSPRVFLRSQSQHDLGASSQTTGHESFVIPKSLPRRRSHSSGGSSGGGGTSNSGNVGSPSLTPHQVISSSLAVTSLPHLIPGINAVTATSLPPLAPTPSPGVTVQGSTTTLMSASPVLASVQGPASPVGSALLAQLLTTGSYPVNCSSSPSAAAAGGNSTSNNQLCGSLASTSSHLSNLATVNTSGNVKVSLVIPGVITGNAGTSTSNISSNITSNNINNIKSTSVLMPPITLSPVTPSTLKNQNFPPQVSSWSPCSPPQALIKQSPPHGESPTSPLMISVPSPPNKAFRPKTDTERVHYKEHRRVCHINAEQKRRSNLKNNFDIMHQLIPSVTLNPNAKISKAVMLQKGAEYIQQLKSERQQLSEEAEKLRSQIETLSLEISNAQALLPATGAPMTHAKHSKLKEMFQNYVRKRTLTNWKFWIFSLITEPLLDSYNASVSTSSLDDLCRSSLAWLDQQCSLNVLRPLVSNSMRKLSTTTNVLAEPESLPEEVYCRVTKQESEKFHSQR